MIDGVEGAAQVEQDQDTGMPATVHVAHYSVVDVDHGGFGRMVCSMRTDACSLKRTATTRSMVFDRKLRLEMGR